MVNNALNNNNNNNNNNNRPQQQQYYAPQQQQQQGYYGGGAPANPGYPGAAAGQYAYAAPPGPPPAQGGYAAPTYAPPPGPPAGQYGGSGYAAPTYAPPSHPPSGQYAAPTYAPPSNPPSGQYAAPSYAPPPGPPSRPAQYAAPSGPPPAAGGYQPPAGPPPPGGALPYGHLNGAGYAPPPGAPPGWAGSGAATMAPTNRMRRALFIGINYVGSKNALGGCHQDVRNMRAFFERRFPHCQEMLVLTDEGFQPATYRPTRKNLLDAMRWLVAGAQPGDHFFFHYSGHGGSLPDQDGDEDDGQDETILPVDFEATGQIRDDDLHAIMCRPLPAGSFLTAIFDCCHSGTMLDLPFTYLMDANDQLVTVNNFEAGGKALLAGGMRFLSGDKKGGMQMAMQGVQMLMKGAQQQGGGGSSGRGGGLGGILGALG
ncbi:Ca(2+)-dependent cysteine protease, partial [Cladochytrium tenue]